MKVKVLDLFAGTRSFSKEAEAMRMDTFSIDNNPKFKGISLVKDMEFVTVEDIPWEPDIIWASLPCTSYSLAGISSHRLPDGTAWSEFAKKSDLLAANMITIIKAFPNAVYYVENPRATLRNMPYMAALGQPVTVWYCRYGAKNAKPTDIWTNNLRKDTLFGVENPDGWTPRPECWNGNKNCHHEAARRSSKTGTQGLKNDTERSKVPAALCREVLISSVSVVPKPPTHVPHT